MKLSVYERLALMTNYQVLAKTDLENAETYEEYVEILRNGYEPLYYRLTDWMAKDDEVITEEEASYVYDVLGMFDAIRISIETAGMTLTDQETYQATFTGFDGNNEGRLLGFAQTYCGDRRFEHLKRNGEIPNSHGPVRGRYESMLVKWKGMGKKHIMKPEEITQLIQN